MPGRGHHRAGKKMQRVVGRHRPHDLQLSGVQAVNVGTGRVAWNQGSSRAHGDGFRGRSQAKLTVIGVGIGSRNIRRLLGEPGGQYPHAKGPRLDSAKY